MADPRDDQKAGAVPGPLQRSTLPQKAGLQAGQDGAQQQDSTSRLHVGSASHGPVRDQSRLDPSEAPRAESNLAESADSARGGIDDGAADQRAIVEDQLRAHYPWIVRWCLFELRDRARAFDCAQDVMLEVTKGLAGFEQRSQLKTWMYVIVRRTIGKFRRKEQRRGALLAEAERGIDEEGAAEGDEPGRLGQNPEQLLIQSAELRNVLAAIDTLSEMQRQTVYLFYFEDLSVEETAARLGISGGTVKTHLSRAREALREQLEDTGEPKDAKE